MRLGLTSWQYHLSLSHNSHKYLGQGWFWTLTLWPRLGVKLWKLWQQDIWNATSLGWLLDLYNYLEKFLYISTCLYFNVDMSLTCINKFLVILIMKQIWCKKCLVDCVRCSEVRFMKSFHVSPLVYFLMLLCLSPLRKSFCWYQLWTNHWYQNNIFVQMIKR